MLPPKLQEIEKTNTKFLDITSFKVYELEKYQLNLLDTITASFLIYMTHSIWIIISHLSE